MIVRYCKNSCVNLDKLTSFKFQFDDSQESSNLIACYGRKVWFRIIGNHSESNIADYMFIPAMPPIPVCFVDQIMATLIAELQSGERYFDLYTYILEEIKSIDCEDCPHAKPNGK